MSSTVDAYAMVRKAHLSILAVEAGSGFSLTTEQLAKFNAWLQTQKKLMDGCISFDFCPCAMGMSLIVKNELGGSSIDLTEY